MSLISFYLVVKMNSTPLHVYVCICLHEPKESHTSLLITSAWGRGAHTIGTGPVARRMMTITLCILSTQYVKTYFKSLLTDWIPQIKSLKNAHFSCYSNFPTNNFS